MYKMYVGKCKPSFGYAVVSEFCMHFFYFRNKEEIKVVIHEVMYKMLVNLYISIFSVQVKCMYTYMYLHLTIPNIIPTDSTSSH